MRTTVTLEPDVAARLKALRKRRGMKAVINDALRRGLDELEREAVVESPKPFRTKVVDGGARIRNVDNVWQVIEELDD